MTSLHLRPEQTVPHPRNRLFRGVSLFAVACALTTSLPAQTPPADNAGASSTANTTDAANADGRARRANFNPAEIQARMLTNLREQLAVKDDAEWTLIAERITAVMDLRRGMMAGGFGLRTGGGGNRPNRPGAVANPEIDALRAAVTDNLPDAEIKARLARVREVRKQNEEKLAKAQEDLRSVLTVRQEAVAVAAGLLP